MKPHISILLLLLAFSGCALTSKSAPAPLRWYTPEALDTPRITSVDVETSKTAASPRLRLGRVTSSAHLRNRIVYRHAPHELGTYEDDRWTETPESYLRRALERQLFEEGPFVRGYSPALPTLDVELVAFEEVRRGDVYSGRVQVTWALRDEATLLASGEAVVERPAAGPSMADVVAAIGAALGAATSEVAIGVRKRTTAP